MSMSRVAKMGIVSGGSFLLLASLIYTIPERALSLDAYVSGIAAPLQTFESVQFFLIVTALGSGVGIIAVAIGFAYIVRLSTPAVLRLTTLLTFVLIGNRLLKDLFERERPDVLTWFDALSSYSFPSAHASGIIALYGFIALVWYSRMNKWYALAIPALIIFLVGLSRIVLNAHHFTDVIGGYLFGLSLLSISFLIPFEKIAKRYG